MRLILDTNLWISFLISSKYEKLDKLLIDQKCTLLFSKELLEEFIAVAQRPKLKRFFSKKRPDGAIENHCRDCGIC